MSRSSPDNNTHVALAMAIRRLELQYGLFIHTSSEWIYFSSVRPRSDVSVFAALQSPELGAALEREVDTEPRQYKVLPS